MRSKRQALYGIAVCVLLLGATSTVHAQRGRGHAVRPVIVASPFFYPYYDPFWDFYGWGPGPRAFYGRGYAGEGSARLQVTPRETEVYLDGYLVGTVDDFDGISQRLRLPPGEHVIELYLEGHKPISQSIMFQAGQTYRVRHAMEPLASGEAAAPRPAPRPEAAGVAPSAPAGPYDAFGRRPPPGMREGRDRRGPASGAGTITVRVKPADAVITIDGERWDASGPGPLQVQVTPGSHRIEVQKDGYQSFQTTVQVRPGEQAPLNVSLTPR